MSLPHPATPPDHILAINNSQAVLDLFHDLLTGAGYRVTTQAYLNKDLGEIERLAPNLIILDYMWADDDSGWSLLQMLQMNPGTASIPIILCTGAVRAVEDLSGHLEATRVKVVLKPFRIARLLEVITSTLGDAHTAPGAPADAG